MGEFEQLAHTPVMWFRAKKAAAASAAFFYDLDDVLYVRFGPGLSPRES
jgi:hypothetical protein